MDGGMDRIYIPWATKIISMSAHLEVGHITVISVISIVIRLPIQHIY